MHKYTCPKCHRAFRIDVTYSADLKAEQGAALRSFIKRLRQEAGWSQVQLAKQVGVSHAHICYFESGKRHFSQAILWRVLGTFGIHTHKELGRQMAKEGK